MDIPYLFIHSSVDGHLGCAHLLSTVDNAAMNTGSRNKILDKGRGKIYRTSGEIGRKIGGDLEKAAAKRGN